MSEFFSDLFSILCFLQTDTVIIFLAIYFFTIIFALRESMEEAKNDGNNIAIYIIPHSTQNEPNPQNLNLASTSI